MPSRHPSGDPAAVGKGDLIWKVLAGVAGAILVGFIVFVALRPTHRAPQAFPVTPNPSIPVGAAAPSFDLPRLGGGAPVSLAATRGTPTIVNFFASWCQNCRAELAAFATLTRQVGSSVAVIGVDSNDTNASAAEHLLASAGADYPVGVDADAKVATSYLLNALPVTYFLDAQGRVVHVAFGAQTIGSLTHWASVLTKGRGSS